MPSKQESDILTVLEGGRDLIINMKWGERGGGGESTTMTMSKRGDAAQVNIGGKGDKGMTKVTITGG
jgi:hypothetical protein